MEELTVAEGQATSLLGNTFSISATRNSPISLQYYSEDSSLGVEYFQGSTFGYTVYGMLGILERVCFEIEWIPKNRLRANADPFQSITHDPRPTTHDLEPTTHDLGPTTHDQQTLPNETEEIPENLSENVLSVPTQTNNSDILLHDPVTVKSSCVYGAFFRRR
ncbi:hypothetical protein P5673_012514 [Acropora cervicornis]|uniref:Uncharacterized protein n=1 Tax=Acropora cervicornis TaxID=6130 RepID=A0AAD9QMY3_ACRCE|nr:hypothetical protein P5673_012514 [Acropora cervicornis]